MILTDLINISNHPVLNLKRKVKYLSFYNPHDEPGYTPQFIINIKVLHYNDNETPFMVPNIDIDTVIRASNENFVYASGTNIGRRIINPEDNNQGVPEYDFWVAMLSNLPEGANLFEILEGQILLADQNNLFNDIY